VSGAQPYEDVLTGHKPALRIERSPDDIYMLYTGGTTGMPKGVMYAIGDFSGNPDADADASSSPGALARVAAKEGTRKISLTCAPLMHGTGMLIGCFEAHLVGGQVITLTNRSLDPHEVLDTIERHRVTMLTIVGDSFAKPLIRALDEGRPDGSRYDTSSIDEIVSAGVMWTTEVKQQLLDRIEQASLYDAMGASEGTMGFQISTKGTTNETARFQVSPTTKVFTEDDREVQPGSEEIGIVAAGGRVPLGYYKDPEKSARTFRVVDGVRYSFPGDFAKVAEDGSLILLGRGSQVINSGGEKIFPEEVEEAVKRVDGVVDCLVVGIEDDRFGQAVTAVVSVADGLTVDSATIIASVKQDLAGFKAPRSVVFVDQVPRAPNGKADYRRAREYAESPTP
jgi:fatty-acyl-CoA synthase